MRYGRGLRRKGTRNTHRTRHRRWTRRPAHRAVVDRAYRLGSWRTRPDRCTTPTRTSWSRRPGSKATSPTSYRARLPVLGAADAPSTQAFDVDRIRRAARRSRVPGRGRVADPAAQELRRRPARSSRTTGRARSTCSASRASSCSTRSRARTCCASSATAIRRSRSRSRAASTGRCSRGARSTRGLLPVCIVPLGDMAAAVALTREAIDGGAAALQIGQYCPPGHSPSHVDLEPVWAMAAEAGVPVVLHVAGAGAQRDESRRSSRTACRPCPTSTAATATSSRSTTCRSRCR